MDSYGGERERGITILAKNTSVDWQGTKVNIVDTPGHADFGGEVERVLNMVDGVLLLIDAVAGPQPQTRFVLRKALELGHKVVVVVNKIDRPQSRPDWVVDTTFDLFCDLGANDEQVDFKVVYASALKGLSGNEPDDLREDLKAVFDAILTLPKPKCVMNHPAQVLVSNIDYDGFKGRMGIGRIAAGSVSKGSSMAIAHPNKDPKRGRVSELFMFNNLGRVSIDEAYSGDIVMFCGFEDVEIGDTLTDADDPRPLTPLDVEEPTVRMSFSINTSEFAGREGTFVTSRNLRDRLSKELERNVALRVEDTDSADTFEVLGRGALHLTILIENMRREGYELMIGAPSVIYKQIDGERHEPFEQVEVEVASEYVGAVVDMLGRRRGEMIEMSGSDSENISTVKYTVPTRGLLGIKNALLTNTRGTAVLNTIFAGYKPYAGDLPRKDNGSLLAYDSGKVTSYGIEGAQDRGKLIVSPGEPVYKNQIVGIHQRPGDLPINVCKQKALTNHRSATKGITTGIQGLVELSLDDAIEYIGNDELVEVTPQNIRLTKKPNLSRKGKK
eukprot:Plantae.Rhodophyta-Rhodochaete_pulchella.ctg2515.p1 GENE.Plantae.Rhodophyta-Rhodochaete_pulchella.ctg2515~~Plantae.Rhodophyta-Rhodochaete_pulchella.ctg2515.p1  ORF type:complete len:617 (+),score=137.34 Plantae.Rhodophyta-Rhodochaete_pulchella.ctg2515:183-1853(+)